jgi:hypothetical protein
MSTVAEPTEQSADRRIRLTGVDWDTFWKLASKSRGARFAFDQGDDGTYADSPVSRFLPIRAEDARRWLIDEDSRDRSAWEERVAEWARGLARRDQPG